MATGERPWFRLEAAALDGIDARVRSVIGREKIAEPFRFAIELRIPGDTDVDIDALIRDPAVLIFLRGNDERRRVHGAIVAASDRTEPDARHTTWEVELAPRISDLALNQRLEVHVGKSVPRILEEKLAAAGLDEKDFSLALGGKYVKREFVVQYEESDLDFLRRVSENVGIAFTFLHDDDRDQLVFVDSNDGYPVIDDVPYRAREAGDGVYRLSSAVRRLPRSVRLRDYNYQSPSLEVEGEHAVVAGNGGEIYDYGPNVATAEEARHLARIRAEELRVQRHILTGESDWMPLRAGAICTIDGHPRGPQKVLIVEVEHDAEVTALSEGTGEEHGYQNRFVAIPAEVEYRPPRTTPRPRVSGYLTGIIEGGDGQYAHLDEHGRYRVRLLFDDSDTPEAHASLPLRMAQPHAGPGYGMHFPLRAGVEVLIACIDGDPDRPVIAACVPNAETPSPVNTGNAAKNILRTGGGNEIAIDDTKGAHRIKLTSPHKDTIFQLGAPNAAEDGAVTSTSGHVSTVSKATTNTFSMAKFDISAFKAATAGNVISIAEINAVEVLTLVLEGLEAAAEVVVNIMTEVKNFHTKEIADAEKTSEALEPQIEAEEEKLAEMKKKRDEAAAHVTPPASEPPASRHGGKHGGRHGGDSSGEADPPEEPVPTEAEIEAQQEKVDGLKNQKEAADKTKEHWKEYEESTEKVEATAAAVGGAAKLFSLVGQIYQLKLNAHAVKDAIEAAAEINAFLLPTKMGFQIPPVPPFNIAKAEGSAVLLGEESAVVSAPETSILGTKSVSMVGRDATIASARSSEVQSTVAVHVYSGPVTAPFASLKLRAPGITELKGLIKTTIEAPDVKVTGTAALTGESTGALTLRGGTVEMKSTTTTEIEATTTATLSALTRVTVQGTTAADVQCGLWGLGIAPDGLILGGQQAPPMPLIELSAEGFKLSSGAFGHYELDTAGMHTLKGNVVTLDAPIIQLGGELVQLG